MRIEFSFQQHRPSPVDMAVRAISTNLAVLGLEYGAAIPEIKARYRGLAHKHHPDRPGGDALRMKEINTAWNNLRALIEGL